MSDKDNKDNKNKKIDIDKKDKQNDPGAEISKILEDLSAENEATWTVNPQGPQMGGDGMGDLYSGMGGFDMPYDAEGGHTKEEAEAEFERLFRELHGDSEEPGEPAANKQKVFVVGHINPDTDTIAAAMAYADLKNQIDPTASYIPMRAGKINEETMFVLNEAGLEAPEFMASAGTQIEDIVIRDMPGISSDITLKKAWGLFKERGVVTLPVTEQTRDLPNAKSELKGLITVKDIGSIYMDASDPDMLTCAKTSYNNIRDAVEGELLLDDDRHRAANGKVVVGTGDFEMISDFVKEGDIVIGSNRKESHMAAINAGASMIIVCLNAAVDQDIIDLAKEKNCAIISTAHDTYTTARLMNQSIPVSYVMVTDNLVTFKKEDYIETVKKTMAKQKHRDFPVLDKDGYYAGMISRRFLVDTNKKKVILVDHNEKSQAIEDIGEAEILEIIDHHRLSSVETMEPVFFRNEPVGSTSTIIYGMYKECGIIPGKKYAHMMCAGILSDTLMFKSPTTSEKDKMAAIELANMAGIDMSSFSSSMFRAGSEVGGKDPIELIGQDFKKFTVDGNKIGIGQINSMDKEELLELKDKVIGHLEQERKNRDLDMLFFMLTDIVNGRSDVLFAGKDSKDILEEAFEAVIEGDSLIVEGLISRKKQMVPEIIGAMHQ